MATTIGELQVLINGDASGLQSAIASVSGELAGLKGAAGSFGDVGTAAAGAAKDVDGVTTSASGAAKGITGIGGAAQGASKKISGLTQAGKQIKEVGEAVDTITKPLQQVAVLTATGAVAATKFAMDFENNFAKVEKTVDGTPEQLAQIKQGIIDLSTTGINGRSALPQTTAELTEIAAAGGQLGIQTENLLEFTETMAQMGTATNLSGEVGAQTLARFMNVAGVAQTEVGNLGSAIVDLGNNFATSESEIANMAMNMGATGNVVGMSAQDILAYSPDTDAIADCNPEASPFIST